MAYNRPTPGRLDARQNTTNYDHPQETNLLNVHRAMDYNVYGQPILRIDDTTVQHTSKNRRKISNIEIIDYASFQHSKQSDVWDEQITGTASSTHDEYLGMVKLQVGGTLGDQIIRQTKRVQRYIPGRQNEVSMAVIFGTPTSGVRRRFGLFDQLNGAFFEDAGDGTYYVVCRRNTSSGVVEDRVARENWNVDKLDGTGPSGIVADPTKIQFMVIEYEWSGHGQVEFKFVIDNNAFPVHQFNHGNVVEHTWSSTPFLPVRIELTNVTGASGTHTFFQGSHTVTSEGELKTEGRMSSISNVITGKNLGADNTFTPLVAIRMKTGWLDSVVMPQAYSGGTLDNTNIFLRIIENAAITGGTWISYDDESPVEYNLTATGFTGGETLETVYVTSGNQGSVFHFDPNVITQLYRTTTTNLADTSSTFLICAAATASNKSGWGNLRWITIR